jgi:DNA-binding response OmpR family regulator
LAKVLAVDDEPGILRLIEFQLGQDGFETVLAENGDTALKLLESEQVDLVILDVMMPGMDGLETMKRIRESSSVPIILLTARRQDAHKIEGLNLGADDYVAKPFNPEELAARVRAVLRSAAPPPEGEENVLHAGDIEIDLSRRIVKKAGKVVSLSRTEWTLLQNLAENPGKVMLAGDLLERIWGAGFRGDLQYLRVWISRLRGKLETDPSEPIMIKTIPRVGYKVDVETVGNSN